MNRFNLQFLSNPTNQYKLLRLSKAKLKSEESEIRVNNQLKKLKKKPSMKQLCHNLAKKIMKFTKTKIFNW